MVGERQARKLLVIPDELMKEISDFRYAEKIPSEAEAIRILLRAGLRFARRMDDRDAGDTGERS